MTSRVSGERRIGSSKMTWADTCTRPKGCLVETDKTVEHESEKRLLNLFTSGSETLDTGLWV